MISSWKYIWLLDVKVWALVWNCDIGMQNWYVRCKSSNEMPRGAH